MIAVFRRLPSLVAASLVLTTSATAHAHDVAIEQVVRMVVQPSSERLLVSLRVPVTLLGDARLPLLDDGSADSNIPDALLQVVAGDIARNLDFRRGEIVLPAPAVTARIAGDRRGVEVELAYPDGGPPAGLSARVNAFRGKVLQPARSDVRYIPASGAPRLISVSGSPTRVSFDPAAAEVVRQFVATAVETTLMGGGHLLFLISLLLPVRRLNAAVRVVAVLLAVQAGVILAASIPAPAEARAVVDMIGASVVVVTAVCAIAGSSLRTFTLLALAFGLCSGLAFGASFADVQQYAGADGTAARMAFVVAVVATELWLAAVMWATRRWMESWRVPQWSVTAIGSVLVAHLALHAVMARGQELERTGSFAAEHASVMLSVAWCLVMLAVAAVRWTRGRRADRTALSNGLPT
jgi:hypothetical protein